MKKEKTNKYINIYVTETQLKALKDKSSKTGIPVSSLVKATINEYLIGDELYG